MKRLFLSFFLTLMTVVAAVAQITGDGYYRIVNYGLYQKQGKTAFTTITYNRCEINMKAGTGQNAEPVAMWDNNNSRYFIKDVQHADPAAVMYLTEPFSADKCNILAQGVSMRGDKMFNGTLRLRGSQNSYVIQATMSGTTATLFCSQTADGGHHILTGNIADGYQYWSAYPIDSNNDINYFGVEPKLKAGNKYYAPYYVSFPFKTKSDGMKVYRVSLLTDKFYALEEIQGIVPAKTPVLIECSSDDPSKNRLDILAPDTSAPEVGANSLVGNFFCNPFMDEDKYKDAVTPFDAKTMRVWNVDKDGNLVLSTATASLSECFWHDSKVRCLNPNQSYVMVPSTAAETITSFGDIKTTLTFDSNGGTAVVPASVTDTPGKSYTKPADPTREGYTFKGWDPALPETMPLADMTVKAQWEKNKYTVKFLLDDGSTIKEETLDYGAAITKPADPTKTGAQFVKWNPDVDATVPAHNVTYTAVFSTNTYTITFDTDGGSAIAPISGHYGDVVTKPGNPTKNGYVFNAWDKEIPATMPAENITIKALWTALHTITFDTDGGTVIAPVTLPVGATVTAPQNPTKLYYDFAGWTPSVPAVMPDADLTVKAQWTAAATTETIPLAKEWNWVAFTAESANLATLDKALSSGTWTEGDEVKSGKYAAAYSKNNSKWVGSLTRQGALSNSAMYKVRSSKDQNISISGKMQIPSQTDITVAQNWNYISFLPIMDMDVNEALANYPADKDDIIKSQDASAVYDGRSWTGDLKVLSPGKGYMLLRKSSRPVSFRFPDVASASSKSLEAPAQYKSFAYSGNMSVIAEVADGQAADGDMLVAMVGDELRGAAVVQNGKALLTIQGDSQANVSLSLMRDGATLVKANAAIAFVDNAVLGSTDEPALIDFGSSAEAVTLIGGTVVGITTIDGKALGTTDVSSLAAGAYLVKTENNGITNVVKIIKK